MDQMTNLSSVCLGIVKTTYYDNTTLNINKNNHKNIDVSKVYFKFQIMGETIVLVFK